MENAPAPVIEEQPSSEALEATTPEVQPAPEAAPTYIEAGGKQFSNVDELKNAYANSQGAMTQAQQESARLKGVEEQWTEFGSYLDNTPGLREHIEAFEAEGPVSQRPMALDPNAQEIQHLKQQVEAVRLDKEITDLSQNGFSVTPGRKAEMLRHIAMNPNVKNASMAYKDLYYEADMKHAKDTAATGAAEKAASNAAAYPAPPTGVQPPDKSFDDLSSEEQGNELLRDIGNANLSNLGG